LGEGNLRLALAVRRSAILENPGPHGLKKLFYDQLRRKAHREDLMQLNRRMRDSHGNQMRRKLFSLGPALKPIMRWTWSVARCWSWTRRLSMMSPWPHG
jgi:hypothetical protein